MNSEDYRNAIRLRLGNSNNVHLIQGIGVDTQAYYPNLLSDKEKGCLRDSLGVSDKQCLMLMVAEFIHRKRHIDVLRALLLIDSINRPIVAFAGSGPLLSAIQDFVRDNGLYSNVRFLGYRTDIPALLSCSNALLLPSMQEGLPRCVLEAQASRVLVIGANARGTADLLENGHGLLHEIGDIAQLAAHMSSVSIRFESASPESQRALERIEIYRTDRIADSYMSLFHQLTRPKTEPSSPHLSHFKS
jgi:glycosyltransferase involved in cell wall biosynthesis